VTSASSAPALQVGSATAVSRLQHSQSESPDAESAVRNALRGGPLAKGRLSKAAKTRLKARDFDALLGRLVAEHKIFVHHKRSKTGLPTKTIAGYALEPQPAPEASAFLATTAKALRAAVHKARAHGVADSALLDELCSMLDLQATEPKRPDTNMDAEVTLSALRELSRQEPAGTLIPVRRLRSRLELDKARFDAAVLELARAELVILHHHDLPDQLEATEREGLVKDRHGTHYVGIALRKPS
jgi:hypothetical protein